MGYCRRAVVIALMVLLVLDWDAMDSIFHIKSPYTHKLKLIISAKAIEVSSSVDSETIPLRNCKKLCRFNGFNAILVKGPVPPSGPSHRGNSVPNNR